MVNSLIKKIAEEKDTKNPEVRVKACFIAGITGILCNSFLFALKLIVGVSMKSIAIISDAFNNLSDMGSAVVTIIGAKLSQRKPDKEHPFGHGRYEYISSLIVSFIIMLVGFELFKTSVQKIFNPEEIFMSPLLLGILCISLPVKLWMYSYNKRLGTAIKSGVIMASARDNLNDVVATGAVIVTTLVTKLINIPSLDGIVGTAVSVMIMYSGFGISKDTIGILLGTPPEKEMTDKIRKMITDTPGVVGVHDLIVHDYGPGRVIASVHAEVPDNCNIVEIHEIIDDLECRIGNEMGIHIVIHMDPISVDCEYTSQTKIAVQKIVKGIDERMNIHDFRMVDGTNNINLIFDIEVPGDFDDVENLKSTIAIKLAELDSRFNPVINIDTIYS